MWQIEGNTQSTRAYQAGKSFELTLNARWDGSQWVQDDTGRRSVKWVLEETSFHYLSRSAGGSFSDSSWSADMAVNPALASNQTFDTAGNWTSAGGTNAYVAFEGHASTSVKDVGSAMTYRKVFPSTPSSYTFTLHSWANIASGPVPYMKQPHGAGAYCTATTGGAYARFYASCAVY